ncbi:MAG: hypothetical protein ACR2IT_00855 [Pirellulales bacterium]
MVTTTTNEELPTHDANGTDLVRVADLRRRGYQDSLIAECLGIPSWRVRYAIQILTGDRDGCPSPEEIAALCQEIQAGWTPEMAVAARRGEVRNSSITVRPDAATTEAQRKAKVAAYWAEYRRRKLENADLPITYLANIASELRWQVQVRHDGLAMKRVFATREEALEAGREWLRRAYEKRRRSDSCCVGK